MKKLSLARFGLGSMWLPVSWTVWTIGELRFERIESAGLIEVQQPDAAVQFLIDPAAPLVPERQPVIVTDHVITDVRA